MQESCCMRMFMRCILSCTRFTYYESLLHTKKTQQYLIYICLIIKPNLYIFNVNVYTRSTFHVIAHALYAWDRMRAIRARCSERHPGGKSGRGCVRFIAIPHDRAREPGHAYTHTQNTRFSHALKTRVTITHKCERARTARVRKYPLRAQPIIFS